MNYFIQFWKRNLENIYEIINNLLGISYYKKCFLLIFFGVALYVPFMNSYNATHDEQAAMLLFSYPWKEMFKLISIEDGHPPLYHIVYRLFQLGGDIHNVFPLRVATLSIFVLTALLGVFPLKRLLGENTSLFYIICVFFMPSALWLSVNVRMYPLAVYIISGTFIYSQLILFDNKKSDWLFFALFSVAGLYTHYFCCIALAIIWGIVFLQFLLKKEYKKMALLLGLGFIISLLYLPWIFAFLQQYNNMKKTWFPQALQRDMAIYGAFFQLRNLGEPILECLFYFLGAFSWILIWEYMIDKKKGKNTTIVKNIIIIFWGLVITTFLISVYIRPTLCSRFLIVIMGLLYIGASIALQHFKDFRKIFWCILSVTYVLGYMKYYTIANDKGIKNYITEFHKKIPENSLIIYTDTWTHIFAEFYLKEYDKVFAPFNPYILLFQDRVLQEKENNSDLSKYQHIYLLRRQYVSAKAIKYYADEFEHEEDTILSLRNGYSDEDMIVRKINKEGAANLLKKSELFFKESLHQ